MSTESRTSVEKKKEGKASNLSDLGRYVGNRALVRNWRPKYILLRFVGATLGVVFYFVIRGGFFSPNATVDQLSPYGFAALAGSIGMFSEQAVLKLKEAAETLPAKPQPGANAKPQQTKSTICVRFINA